VDGIKLTPYNYPLCMMPLEHSNMPSPRDDPSPLVPSHAYALKQKGRDSSCAAAIEALPDPQASVFYRSSPVRGVAGQVIVVSGLNVEIVVRRFWVPHVITGEVVGRGWGWGGEGRVWGL
jgi:hypothetical protein